MTDAFRSAMHVLSGLNSALAVFGWDQETYLPAGAAAARAEHIAVLSGLRHQHLTSPETQRAVENALHESDSLSPRMRAVVQRFAEDLQRELKLPLTHVQELARACSLGQDAWKRAKQEKNFALFSDSLKQITDLKRSEAELLGYREHPYDAMLDLYEPGLTVRELDPAFLSLASGTRRILDSIAPHSRHVRNDVLFRYYSKQDQFEFAKFLITQLGFSFETGRVDLSEHPFCTSFDISDVRLTTRIRENDVRSCLFGLIHEAGHGMYEQGISPELAYTSCATGASMGIHESQSLFWENIVARSEEFWSWVFPKFQERFPEQTSDQTPDSLFRAVNVMQPTLNRVESDELTYNLHIIVRFHIERDLMTGALRVDDIPEAWNDEMSALLGVVPPNDAEGCLQDVHWSFGGIGYFPSYTLGKLYAAMLWDTIQIQMPNVKTYIAQGEFSPILQWLRTNVHEVGRTETPAEIMQRVCSSALTEAPFLRYVQGKAQNVYGFEHH